MDEPTDRWRRLESLFAAALKLPEEERPAWLADQCRGDPGLRRQVEALLRHSGGSDAFFRDAVREAQPAGEPGPAVGATLGRFRILDRLGAGGMGEVYRAEDPRLGRQVAIKVLPAASGRDPERLARFTREAKVVASLSHPGIAAVYEVGGADDRPYLVMELATGETLAARLRRGRLPVPQALPIARQIARALEAAHAAGVVHRDLKPANVMVGPEGEVKVLDFGLAKVVNPPSGDRSAGMADPPTESPTTQVGALLGTAPYMSPEQAAGKPVDLRTDIWAFGVVCWEMLTGHRPFPGDIPAEVTAEVLGSDLDLRSLPPDTPPGVVRLLSRCLRRDPRNRLQSIGDARIVLEEVLSGVDPAASRLGSVVREGSRPRRWLAPAAVLVGLLAVAGWMLFGPKPDPAGNRLSRLALPVPDAWRAGEVGISEAGEIVVYRAFDATPGADRRARLFVRRLDARGPEEVRGSEGVVAWAISPDGRSVAFTAPARAGAPHQRVYRTSIDGRSSPVPIADVPEGPSVRSLVWSARDLVFATRSYNAALLRFPFAGGASALDLLRDGGIDFIPFVDLTGELPGARHALAQVRARAEVGGRHDAVLIDLETGALVTIVEDASEPALAPSGHLLFRRRGTLFAMPFDAVAGRGLGVPVPVEDDLWAGFGPAGGASGRSFAIAATGTLVYLGSSGPAPRRRVVVSDAQGAAASWLENGSVFTELAVSPDGRALVLGVGAPGADEYQLGLSDLSRPGLRPLSDQPGKWCEMPAWSPDGGSVAYGCHDATTYTLYLQGIDGAPARTLVSAAPGSAIMAAGFTPDGKQILATEWSVPEQRGRSFLLPTTPAPPEEATRLPLWEQHDDLDLPQLSPDGRWIAHTSVAFGREDLYVRRVLAEWRLGPPVLVPPSAHGRVHRYQWGKPRPGEPPELFFSAASGPLYAVTVGGSTSDEPTLSEVRETAIDVAAFRWWDMRPDGGVVAVEKSGEELGADRILVVLGWSSQLR